MDVLVLHISKYAVVKVYVMFTKANYLIVDSGGAAYSGELVHGFKSPISIHIYVWCVVYYPVQWAVDVGILIVFLFLVNSYGWCEAFTIGSGKYQNGAHSPVFTLHILSPGKNYE